jgi:hypothetical protein
MSDIPGLLRKSWLVVAAGVLGSAIIIAASLAVSETALMWIGGAVGIGIGGTIVANERRAQPKRTPSPARRRRR